MIYRNQFLKYMSTQEQEGGEGAAPANSEPQVDVKALQDELERLRTHHNKLLDETKAAKAAKQQQEEATRLAAEEAARKSGDVEALEKSWQGKYSRLEAESKSNADKLQSQIKAMLVDGVAASMAAKIAVSDIDSNELELLTSAIKGNLDTIERDGKLCTCVIENGKPSALTIEELEKAITEKYPRLVKGSLASGAGGDNSKPSGGAGGSNGSGSMVDRARNILKNHK